MALYVNGKKVVNSLVVDGDVGNIVQNLKLNEGKLNVRTGAISADSDYYYSDPFPCPMTTAFFDIGESANSTDLGFAIYDTNGTYTEYFTANARYRTIDITKYVPDPTGYTCRLSFSKAHLADIVFRDVDAEILYAPDTPVVIGDEHYQWGNRGIDYIESFLVSTDTSAAFATEAFYATYSDGVLTRVKYSRQEGGRTVTLGDFQSYIGDNTSWLWQVTALADMEIRVDDITNGTQGQKQQVHSGDIILSGVPISGLYQYEIKRYS